MLILFAIASSYTKRGVALEEKKTELNEAMAAFSAPPQTAIPAALSNCVSLFTTQNNIRSPSSLSWAAARLAKCCKGREDYMATPPPPLPLFKCIIEGGSVEAKKREKCFSSFLFCGHTRRQIRYSVSNSWFDQLYSSLFEKKKKFPSSE